jgi:hypothetical protein
VGEAAEPTFLEEKMKKKLSIVYIHPDDVSKIVPSMKVRLNDGSQFVNAGKKYLVTSSAKPQARAE